MARGPRRQKETALLADQRMRLPLAAIFGNAKTASQDHAELMRAYRITGEAQRAELFGIVAAELITHAFAGEAILDGNL